MTIIHMAMFEWKPTATHEDVKDACLQMLELPLKCLHPVTKKPYVISSIGGKDTLSTEDQYAHTHGFVVEFENGEDRAFYLLDPAYIAFEKMLSNITQEVRSLDFEPGKF